MYDYDNSFWVCGGNASVFPKSDADMLICLGIAPWPPRRKEMKKCKNKSP